MDNTSNAFLPNPFTPMAFLPPDQAYQKTITDYITIGGLGVLVWDILTHLHSDYILVTQYRITVPTGIYLVSRWSTLLHGIVNVLFHTAPIGNCDAWTKVTCAMYHVTVSSTAFLFFLRVRAIFGRNLRISIGFFILWVIVIGGSLTSVLSMSGVPIGNTKYCANTNFKSARSSVANITLAVFDTCIFAAITWRLSNSQASVLEKDTRSSTPRFDLFGRYLPSFTQGLLHDGQKYYMVATIANLLVVIFDLVPSIPMEYRATSVGPAIALTNIMACRVFRHTKMRRTSQDTSSTAISTIMFRRSNNAPTPLVIHIQKHQDRDGLATSSISENQIHDSGEAM